MTFIQMKEFHGRRWVSFFFYGKMPNTKGLYTEPKKATLHLAKLSCIQRSVSKMSSALGLILSKNNGKCSGFLNKY
jgi:hypothetical protein